MSNSVDPDQLASEEEANWSGSTCLQRQAYLGSVGRGLMKKKKKKKKILDTSL